MEKSGWDRWLCSELNENWWARRWVGGAFLLEKVPSQEQKARVSDLPPAMNLLYGL